MIQTLIRPRRARILKPGTFTIFTSAGDGVMIFSISTKRKRSFNYFLALSTWRKAVNRYIADKVLNERDTRIVLMPIVIACPDSKKHIEVLAHRGRAMNLRELLKSDFGVDFPISGGTGNSRDDPIVVHRTHPNDYVGVEYGVIRFLCEGRGVTCNLVQQALILHNGRNIDQLKIETKEVTDTEIITQTENYYFDITECV